MDNFKKAQQKFKEAKVLVELAHTAEVKTRLAIQEICDHRHKTSKSWSDGGSYYDRATYYETWFCPECELKEVHTVGRGGYG